MNDDPVPEPAILDDAAGRLVAGKLEHGGRVIAPDRIAHLRERIAALEAWGSARGWVGPDPYEGLNARRAGLLKRSPLGRRILIQAVRRSPLDLRRPLGIEPELDAASVAHVLAARVALGDAEGVGWAIDRLLELRVPGYEEPCWGYHFDVETRFFFYPRTTPNTIATAFAGQALLDAHELTGRADLLELATGVGEFFIERVGVAGGVIGYFPGDRTPIHNATALAAAHLARVGALTGRADFTEAATAAIDFVVAHQRDDGAWPYAEGEGRDWVDGLHTGYVLDAVRACAELLADEAFAPSRASPTPAAATSTPPTSSSATARRSSSRTPSTRSTGSTRRRRSARSPRRRRTGPSGSSAPGAPTRSPSRASAAPDGAFAYQRHRARLDRTPHVRWVQAPMLDALSRLLAASTRPRSTIR